jgi:hypothetical protein
MPINNSGSLSTAVVVELPAVSKRCVTPGKSVTGGVSCKTVCRLSVLFKGMVGKTLLFINICGVASVQAT